MRSVMSRALVSTIETSKVINHGVAVTCHLMLVWLNETPGNTVISAMPTNVHFAKGMISMESDRIWREWLNDRIWKAWQ
jgi:hypothetical protein